MKTVQIIRLAGICLLALITSSVDGMPADSRQVFRLQQQVSKYYEIASAGGWGKIILDKKYYSRGQSGAVVKQVKQRLAATEDYSGSIDALFTEDLATAVKKVRKQYGLPLLTSIDAALIKELNVPVEKRIAQLQSNIARLQELQISKTGTHLVANIPEYKLHVYENGEKVFDMNIVVGTSSTKTVTFNSQMNTIVFSPYWNVPSSIVRNELLPAARRNKNYLKQNGYEVVGKEGGLPAIRQKPGAQNSLGKVKFLFPNSHNIYFHDTPAKSLFKMDSRAYSHGCVRLAEPAKLAEYLLRNHANWTTQKIQNAMNSGTEQAVRLSTPVPVSIVYFTAWVDDDGAVNFRDDIYGKDKAAVSTMKVAKL